MTKVVGLFRIEKTNNMKCKHINLVKANMNGSYMGYLCKDCGNLIYKEEQQMRDNNILITKDADKIIPNLGSNNIIINPMDADGSSILNKPMTIGNNINLKSENSIIIGNNIGYNGENEIFSVLKEMKDLLMQDGKSVNEVNKFEKELKNPNPNITNLKELWDIIKKLSTINGVHNLYLKIEEILKFLA